MTNNNSPNVLVIVSDHHHWRMTGYLDHPHVQTPALDSLAADGAVFTNAYCNNPVCGPARSCYMSGLYNFEIGHWSNGVPVPADLRTWSQRVAEAGVESTLLGKIDFPGVLEGAGFENYRLKCPRGVFNPYPRTEPQGWAKPGCRRGGFMHDLLLRAGPAEPEGETASDDGYRARCGVYDQDRAVADWTLDFLNDRDPEPEKPWALHVGLEAPHWPYVCPPRFFDMYWPDDVDLPFDVRFPNPDLPGACREFQEWNGPDAPVTDEMIKRMRAAFYGQITCMDEMIGQIIDRLKSIGQYDNTYIIYSTDHGDSMGEHGLISKLSPMQSSIGVPLLIKGPGIEGGKMIDTPVSLLDMYSTVLDIYGLKAEDETHGASWLPLARGEAQPDREPVFCEYHGVGFRGAWYCLIEGNWKYVWYEYYRPSLYNLADDPNEMNDLGNDPAQADRLGAFESTLRSICSPEGVSTRAKVGEGLITLDGRDLTADKELYGYEHIV